MDKKKTVKIYAGIVIVAGIAVASVFFGRWLINNAKGKAESAIAAGIVEIKNRSEIKNYFIELPKEEIKQLINDYKNEGQEKFLMPQFDMSLIDSFSINNESVDSEGKAVEYLTVTGIPSGTEIFSSTDGLISGGIAQRKEPYVWIKQFEGGNDDSDRDNTVSVTYFPAFIVPGQDYRPFSDEISSSTYSPISMGTKITKILSDSTLDSTVVPGGVSLSFAIDKEGDFTFAKMENLLLKNGRIVMLKK